MFKCLTVSYFHQECRARENMIQLPIFVKLEPSASRWKKFKYKLQNIFLASPISIDTIHYLKSSAALYEEQRRHLGSKYSFMIHPFSNFLICWRLLIVIAFMIALIMDPMIVYMPSGQRKNTYRYIMYSIHIFGVCDILIKFFTAYNNPKTKETTFDMKATTCNYLQGQFIFDALANFPLYSVLKQFVRFDTEDCAVFMKILRSICLFKYLENSFNQFHVHYSTRYKIELLLKSAIFMQYICALYFEMQVLINIYNTRGTGMGAAFAGKVSYDDWYVRENMSGKDAYKKYITTLFYVTGILSGTSGRNSYSNRMKEIILSTVVVIVGHSFFCYVIILICWNGINLNWEEIKFTSLLRQFARYNKRKQLPADLYEKITFYVNYKYRGKMFNEQNIINNLSVNLRLQLKLFDCEEMLSRVPFFQTLPNPVVLEIVTALYFNVYLPGEVIITPEEISTTLYFIKFGSVSIKNVDKVELYQLKDFDYFGESALLKDFYVHDVYAIASELTELYYLKLKDWNKILWRNYEVKKTFDKLKNQVVQQDTNRKKSLSARISGIL